MDSTLASALIGGIVSIVSVLVGWFLGRREYRSNRKEEINALAGALLIEIHAAAWHILNIQEALFRAVEEKIVPTASGVEIYLPTPSPIYMSAGHEISRLGPVAAQWLVEYYTHLERTMARTRRIAALDGRRIKKEVRLKAFSECGADWGYVAWTGSECMKALLPLAIHSLTTDQRESIIHYATYLERARSGENRWALPEDSIALKLIPDDDEVDLK
ncbi:hypothetical protein [Hyphomicrobium sp. MC8b]|uniref:hypothetical protein n=1 Tax=Hyphomicrobium sp. MC8b TaxID=300273 RepID=UPI00391D4D77